MHRDSTPIIELQREGYEARLYESPDGFLLYWGDYVANSWLRAFETLEEALNYMAEIDREVQS